jgi:hypothetical protein
MIQSVVYVHNREALEDRFDGWPSFTTQRCRQCARTFLDDLLIEDLGNSAAGAARMLVSLPSNNGLEGSLKCEHVSVVAANDFEPGLHSVYHRQ